MIKPNSTALAFAAVILITSATHALAEQRGGVEGRLYSLADKYMVAYIGANQPSAAFQGLPVTSNDRFFDNTAAGRTRLQKVEDNLLRELRSLPVDRLYDASAQTFYMKFLESVEADVGMRVCRKHLWDLNHMFGPHSALEILAGFQPVNTTEERSDALRRWQDAVRFYREEIENLRDGTEQGYSAPRRVVRRVVEQLKDLRTLPPEQHPFRKLLTRTNDPAFRSAFLEVLEKDLLPAMLDYEHFLREEYLPLAREELGLHAIPEGRDCYMAHYRKSTTLQRSPEEVHRIGVEAVNRNTNDVEMLGTQLYERSGFSETIRAAHSDQQERFNSQDDLSAFYAATMKRSLPVMSDYFQVMPEVGVDLAPLPDHQQRKGLSARYFVGPPGENGKFIYDPTSFASESKGSAEIVTFHETYPGHHLQISRVKERKPFHPIERIFSNEAYAEGWGRYAEHLAEEAGLYQTKSALIIRRAWPARGMVADSGMHVLGWTNKEVEDYILASGYAPLTADIDATMDRIAAAPAQLTSYDSGALEILALRREMKERKGHSFDIKEFHELILKDGDIPLSQLRARFDHLLKEEGR